MMKMLKPFIGFWVVNSLLVYVSTLVVPGSYVLGNAYLSPFFSALHLMPNASEP